MSNGARSKSGTPHPASPGITFDDLPEDVQEEFADNLSKEIIDTVPIEEIARNAVKKEIRELFPESVSEEQIALMLMNMQQMKRGGNFQDFGVEKAYTDGESRESTMEAKSSLSQAIDIALLESPQASLYALAIVMMMSAFYFSSVTLAAAGSALLVLSALHYASQ